MSALYVWHLLNVIPGADIKDTVPWDEPGRNRDRAAGILLVVFKLALLVPVLAALRGVLKART